MAQLHRPAPPNDFVREYAMENTTDEQILTLSAQNIDLTAAQIDRFLTDARIPSRDRTRMRIAAEEVLLRYAEIFGENAAFRPEYNKQFGRATVTLNVYGTAADPIGDGDDEETFVHRLLENMSLAPVWSYRSGCNRVAFSAARERKLPEFVLILIATALGLLLGFAARALQPQTLQRLCELFMTPVSDAVMGLLGTLSVLMIFVSIVNGICGMENIQTFRRTGVRMLGRFLALLAGSLGFVTAVTLRWVPLYSGAVADTDFSALWQMVTDIVPDNIPRAFADGNALQVVFLALFTGFAVLLLMPKTSVVAELCYQANVTVQTMLEYVIRLMPLVVFISLFKVAANDMLSALHGIYKYPLIMVICCVGLMAYSLLRTSVTQKVPLGVLLRKLLPTYVIAISTASSSAAYAVNVETCRKQLGIRGKLVKVGIPLGQTMFKPCIIFQAVCGCLCMAELYGVAVSPSQLVMLMLTVFILALAEPPVPGILVSCFTLLFAQLSIPAEAISIILALEFIMDRLGTSTNLLALQTELVQLAGSLNQLDRTKLRS